ncbi:cyclic lactone autoinducer peptide [Syntrophobotulus glycolicus]|nr:cyclic lactone autoinducer peptide [Syntrophobotulus glycolicus]
MKRLLFTAISSVVLLFASASSVFACFVFSHQPNTPKSLQR